MTPLDPDRTLALSYVPAKRRAAVEALWRLDAALGAVLAGGREPLIGQIKLVWWRDALEKIDREKAPAEPVLQAVAEHVVPIVPGAALAAFEQPWAVLLSQEPLSSSDFDDYAARGRLLFRFSAVLLEGVSSADVESAGEAWALVDLARHSGEPDRMAALNAARGRLRRTRRWPIPLRPLGMLHALTRRDIEHGLGTQGSPARMLRMLRHRFTGR